MCAHSFLFHKMLSQAHIFAKPNNPTTSVMPRTIGKYLILPPVKPFDDIPFFFRHPRHFSFCRQNLPIHKRWLLTQLRQPRIASLTEHF